MCRYEGWLERELSDLEIAGIQMVCVNRRNQSKEPETCPSPHTLPRRRHMPLVHRGGVTLDKGLPSLKVYKCSQKIQNSPHNRGGE